jgi:fumarate reductase subunit C
VLAVTIHVPIGLRAICIEWLRWRGRSRDFALLLFAGLLAWSGMGAVLAVYV